MTAAEERDRLRTEVLRAYQAGLKPKGFRKAGRLFKRTRGDLVDFIQIQSDRYPIDVGLKYRVNAEVVPVPLLKLEYAEYPNTPPGMGYHYWSKSLGHYLLPKCDFWQTILTETEAGQRAEEELKIIVRRILPDMERITSTQDYIDAIKDGSLRASTNFRRDKLVALWEGRPLPNRDDYLEIHDPIVTTPAVEQAIEAVAKQKWTFFQNLSRKRDSNK